MVGGRRRLQGPRSLAGLLVILLVAGLACRESRPVVIPSPEDLNASAIQGLLESEAPIARPAGAQIAALVVVFPAASDQNPTVTLDPVSAGSIPDLGLLDNTGRALEEPGVYVAVLDGGLVPIFLSRVCDPLVSRGEGLSLDEGESDAGILESASTTTAGGSLGLRVPFVRGAFLEIFRVRPGAGGENKVDSPVLLITAFPGGDIPATGWAFEAER